MPFHVTPVSNLPAILVEGLQPSIGPRSALLGESQPAVYLFQTRSDVENALMGWLGDELDEEEVAIIQLSALECWHPAEAARGQGADFELVILRPIPAGAVEAVFDECWQPAAIAACDANFGDDFAP